MTDSRIITFVEKGKTRNEKYLFKHLVYIINLIIFAPMKVESHASNLNFPLFKATGGL